MFTITDVKIIPIDRRKKNTNIFKETVWKSHFDEAFIPNIISFQLHSIFHYLLVPSFLFSHSSTRKDYSFVNCKQFHEMSLACLNRTNCLNENFENYLKKLCHFQTQKYSNAEILGLASFRHWRCLNLTSVYKKCTRFYNSFWGGKNKRLDFRNQEFDEMVECEPFLLDACDEKHSKVCPFA